MGTRQRSTGAHSKYLYEILEAPTIDSEELTITARVNSRSRPATVGLSLLAHIPLAQQMFPVVSRSAVVDGSWATVANRARALRRLVRTCGELGIKDVHDEAFTRDLADKLITQPADHALLVEATKQRSDAAVFATLQAPKSESDEVAYSDGEIAHLKAAAIAHLDAIEAIHRQFDPDDNEAAEVVEAARERDRQRPNGNQVTGHETPDWSWDDDQIIDWLLLRPDVAHINSVPASLAPSGARERYARLFRAVYPGRETFAAFGVLIMLAGNAGRGDNPSTWMPYGVNHLVHLGGNFGQVKNAKARSHRKWRGGTNFNSKHHSLGGLLILATTLTRFTRAHHTAQIEHAKAKGETVNETIGDAFFVLKARGLPPGIVRDFVLNVGARGFSGWDRFSFGRIRLWCVGQQAKNSPGGTLRSHSRETRDQVYLPRSLDRQRAHDMATKAHEEMATGTAGVLSDCTGDLKIDEDTPCRLGVTACFVCPSGHRTEHHAAALSVVPDVVDVFIRAATEDGPMVQEALTLQRLAADQLDRLNTPVTVDETESRRLKALITHLLIAQGQEPS